MLSFHLGTGGIDNPGEYLGGLELEEVGWLQRHGFILETVTGPGPISPECLPFFDDIILSQDQVRSVYQRLNDRLASVQKTAGFESSAVDKLNVILKTAMNAGEGISTVSD